MSTIREVLSDLAVMDKIRDEQIIDDMNKYFNRISDHYQIREQIITRYGQRIVKIQNPNNPDVLDEIYGAYDQQAFKAKVEAGMVGAVSMGYGNKVVSSLATLFTEPNQKFTLLHKTIEDLTIAEELLNRKRRMGGYFPAMVKADKQACQVGSSLVFPYHLGRRLRYQQISPSAVRAYWADRIIDDKEERAVDKKELEDASVIVIRLNRVDYVTYQYLAIFGESELYPFGRWVRYQSGEKSTAIPDVGQKGAYDYTLNGKPANPLTYWAKQNPTLDLPEYPLAVIYGGITDSDEATPITTSLYEDCKELDVMGSRIMSTAGDAARGTRAIERTEIAKNQPLPKTTCGDVALAPGMRMLDVPHNGQNSKFAMEVLKDIQKANGSGYSIPDYMVVSEDHLLDASSGVALAVKTMPLQKFRRYRADENEMFVRKIFDIERSYIAMFAESDERAAANLLMACEQTWDPGELMLPENKQEEATRIISLKKEGILDEVAAIQEYYKLGTEEEAKEVYTRMKERAAEFPPLGQAQQQIQRGPIGLRGRARSQVQQTPNNDQGQQ